MKLFQYFIISLSIELLTAALLGRKRFDIQLPRFLYVLAIIDVNLVSYPLAWLFFDFARPLIGSLSAWIITETGVVLLEAILLRLQLNNSFRKCLWLSFLINSASAMVGVIYC